MSDNDRPDLAALQEMEQLIRALGDEMAGWRRRAQAAENRLRELGVEGGQPRPAVEGDNRDGALESENQELRSRIEVARTRTTVLAERMRFLRQQLETGSQR